VNSKNGCESSPHQNPIGQPVCSETAGFDATITIRFGRSGWRMSTLAPEWCAGAVLAGLDMLPPVVESF
jgi:hypothetical protein